MNLWIAMVATGLATFLIRLSFIALLGRLKMPELATRALRFVPPAVLSAIIFPELFLYGGEWNLSPGNIRLLAGMVAALVAYRTKNVVWTIIAGMLSLYALQAVLGM
jgi:branched-subunit amino acid transport protein